MRIENPSEEAYKLLHDGALALARMSANGVRIDEQRLDANILAIQLKVKASEVKLRESKFFAAWRREYGASADVWSPTQLAHILYDVMGHECVKKTDKGGRSTGVDALQDIDHPFVRKWSRTREQKQTVGTFLNGIRRETVNGWLHPSFNLNTVVTFRGSGSEPNFQNLPRRSEEMAKLVRGCIIPPDGWHFWELDFKGSEACCNAAICGDPVFQKYMREDPGRVHKEFAAELFMIRKDQVIKRARDRAKNQFVFATFYGSFYKQTARGLWEDVCRDKKLTVGEDGSWIKDHLREQGITELGNCDLDGGSEPMPGTFAHHVRQVEKRLWTKFSVYKRWRENQYENYLKCGYITLPTGFTISGILSRNDTICYPAQGASFHCLLWTIIQLQKWLTKHKMKTRLVGQIHDSLEGNSPPNEIDDVFNEATRIIREDLPKHWPWIVVPMIAEIECGDVDASWHSKRLWTENGGHWGPAENH